MSLVSSYFSITNKNIFVACDIPLDMTPSAFLLYLAKGHHNIDYKCLFLLNSLLNFKKLKESHICGHFYPFFLSNLSKKTLLSSPKSHINNNHIPELI